MIILTSPAKLMTTAATLPNIKLTQPEFITESKKIHSVVKGLSPKDLQDLMEISPKLADENWARNQRWTPNPSREESAPAEFAFTGEVYRGLDVATLPEEALAYLQQHHRILSGLYGILRPFDIIMPYRLEMGRHLPIEDAADLVTFWQEKLTSALNKTAKNSDFILNLASKEYSRSINWKKIEKPMFSVDFLQITATGKLRSIVVYIKHARGLMTRFCAENNIQTLEGVKAFHSENYLFSEELSKGNKLVFVR